MTSRYLRARSSEDAVALLAANPGARLVGGGTLVMSLFSGPRPEVLVDLAFAGLDGLSETSDGVVIGATTPIASLVGLHHPGFGVLREAAAGMVPETIRAVATVGGNVSTGFGSFVAPLLLLGATASIRGPTGVRTVCVDALGLGPGDVLEFIAVPSPAHGVRSGFARMRRTPVGPGIVVLAMAVGPLGTSMAVGGAELRPRLLPSLNDLRPINDPRASGDYRRAMAGLLARDLEARLRG